MIGFVVTPEQAQAANAAIAEAQTSRGMPVFWLAGSYPIYTGEHAGDCFVPCDDATLATPLIGHPPQTPQDFPEFAVIIESMGGLEARIEIPAVDINQQSEPETESI
jgi:hypothetical protein